MRATHKPTTALFSRLANATGGNVTAIADRLHVGRRTVYDWLAQDQEFAALVVDAREALLDLCESQMMLLIRGIPRQDENGNFTGWQEQPDASLIRFHLATRGRSRGYGKTAIDDPTPLRLLWPIVPRADGSLESTPETSHCSTL